MHCETVKKCNQLLTMHVEFFHLKYQSTCPLRTETERINYGLSIQRNTI